MASPPHSPPPNNNHGGKKGSNSGCQVPFIAAGEGSSLTRFKQLSTRRGGRPRTKERTVSSPSLISEGLDILGEPCLTGLGGGRLPVNNNAPMFAGASARLPPSLRKDEYDYDEAEDHPGRRKESGFFQPIKHLSGNLQKAHSNANMQMRPEFHSSVHSSRAPRHGCRARARARLRFGFTPCRMFAVAGGENYT